MVVVFVAVLALNIYGLTLRPNVELTIKALTPESIDYVIEPLKGSFSPLHVSRSYVITMSSISFNSQYESYFMLGIKHTNQYNCDLSVSIPLDKNPAILVDSYVEFDNWKGKKHKIVHSLQDNKSIPLLMQFYGCKHTKLGDLIHINEINLVIIKNSEPSDIKIWNNSVTSYPSLLGYLQVKNMANRNNTDEENEHVFRDLMIYCQKTATIPESQNYISTFQDVYEKDDLEDAIEDDIPKNNWIFQYIPIATVAAFILMIILCNCFCIKLMYVIFVDL